VDKETVEYIKNLLRKGTTTWKGRAECLNRGRYKSVNKKGNSVWTRDCDICGSAYFLQDGFLEVDHIVPVGETDNLREFIGALYCGQDNLQAVCIDCHDRKTALDNARMSFQRKKRIGL
jgi:5-methylcytosine-specific restriction endonuclease McrA